MALAVGVQAPERVIERPVLEVVPASSSDDIAYFRGYTVPVEWLAHLSGDQPTHKLIGGYLLSKDWASLVTGSDMPAASVALLERTYQGFRDDYDYDVKNDQEHRQALPGRVLYEARQIINENEKMRQNGEIPRFDQLFRAEKMPLAYRTGHFIGRMLRTARRTA